MDLDIGVETDPVRQIVGQTFQDLGPLRRGAKPEGPEYLLDGGGADNISLIAVEA